MRKISVLGLSYGQDDLPVGEVRKLLGRDKIVGLSTHIPKQAEDAVRAGVDYIGVGPIFATRTKEDVCEPVGFSYLDWVVKNISVAIGGIKLHNIDQIIARGTKTICLVTEIVGAEDIIARINELLTVLTASSHAS